MINRQTFVFVFGITLLLSQMAWGTAKTLPKGLWHFQLKTFSTEIKEYGVENFAANETGTNFIPLGNFEHIPLDEFNLSHTPFGLAAPFIPELTGTERIIEEYRISQLELNVAYGVTDQWTLFAVVPYVNRLRVNTDESIVAGNLVNDFVAAAGNFGPFTEGDVNVPPKRSRGSGIGDISVGTKYRFNEEFAVFGMLSAGFLRVGEDLTEITQDADGVSAEPTGEASDTYIVGINYDIPLDFSTLELTAMAIEKTEGVDRSIALGGLIREVDPGLTTMIKADLPIELDPKWKLTFGLSYLYSFEDRFREQTKDLDTDTWVNGDFVDAEGSDAAAWLGEIKLAHYPVQFVELYVSYKPIISNDVGGRINDFPGRVQTDNIIEFGMGMFYM